MYNTYYVYEAYFLFGDISLHLNHLYNVVASILMVLATVLTFALLLCSAIMNKRARVFGIITAIMAPIGAIAAHLTVTSYASLDFSFTQNLKGTSSVSMSDAMTDLFSQFTEQLTERVATSPMFLLFPVFAGLVGFASIFLIVYTALLIKSKKGKGLAIASMIIVILRFLFLSPLQTITIVGNYLNLGIDSLGSMIQLVWIVFFYAAWLLPILFVGIQGILNLVNAKKEKAAALAAEAEAPAVVNE